MLCKLRAWNLTISLLFAVLAFSGCTHTPPPGEEVEAPIPETHGAGRVVAVEVEASSREETKRPFRLSLEGGAATSLAEEEALRMVERALKADGFPSVAEAVAERSPAQPIDIRARFSRENSAFGTSLFGMLSPYRHGVHLRAFEGDKLLWELNAVGPSEMEDVRPVLPTLLAASLGSFGMSTGGKKTISIEESDARFAKLKGAKPAKSGRRGLLQRVK